MCANYISIQHHIQRGRGKAAIHLGQPYWAYRLTSPYAVNYLDATNRIDNGNLKIFRRVNAARSDFESPGEKMGDLFFNIIADMSHFLLGDIFVEHDPVYGEGYSRVEDNAVQVNAMTLVHNAPVKHAIGVRIDQVCNVYRMNDSPDPSGYWSEDINNGFPVVLRQNQFYLGNVGENAAGVPMGFQSSDRVTSELFRDIPSTTFQTRYFVYCPPLPGFTIREGDRIQARDKARYVVQHPYRQDVGMVGHMLVCTREISQS